MIRAGRCASSRTGDAAGAATGYQRPDGGDRPRIDQRPAAGDQPGRGVRAAAGTGGGTDAARLRRRRALPRACSSACWASARSTAPARPSGTRPSRPCSTSSPASLALGFAVGVQRGGLDRRRGRPPGRRIVRARGATAAPSLATAATAGVATHVPGLIYLVALNAIAAEDPGPAEALAQVAIYNVLWFAIPLGALALVLRSPATATASARSPDRLGPAPPGPAARRAVRRARRLSGDQGRARITRSG